MFCRFGDTAYLSGNKDKIMKEGLKKKGHKKKPLTWNYDKVYD